jgi:ribosome-binding protein aMBF1 (putative translation factor)
MLFNDVNSAGARQEALATATIGPQLYAEADSKQTYHEARRRIDQIDRLVRALDERREALGMSNAQLAERTELAPELVRRLFSVGGLNPAIGTLTAIADALDLELVPRRRAS